MTVLHCTISPHCMSCTATPINSSYGIIVIKFHILLCIAADCDPLDDPANGTVVLTGTSMGDTATYSCNNGYELEGNRQRMCQMNRQWSGSEPSCRCKLCEGHYRPFTGVEIPHCTLQTVVRQ